MGKPVVRVGIVGLQPGRSWAAVAHLPGIRALGGRCEVAGVANSSRESAVRAAAACGLPRAFESVEDLIGSDDIDVVTVTVRVPRHKDIVASALEAGKSIYCEWPLGKNLEEAEELTSLAKQKGCRTFIGTQAVASPQIRYLKKLISEGVVGRVLSHSIIGYGRVAGPEICDEASELYLLNNDNGATMLTISVAHTLSAMQTVFGRIEDLHSVIATRRNKIFSRERDGYVDMTAPDQIAVQGIMEDESVFSLHYRGGMPPDSNGFLWEINGTEGVLRITGLSGCIQIEELKMAICRKGENGFQAISVPSDMLALCPDDFTAGNVARMYEMMWRDLTFGIHTAPSFDDALALHRLMRNIENKAL